MVKKPYKNKENLDLEEASKSISESGRSFWQKGSFRRPDFGTQIATFHVPSSIPDVLNWPANPWCSWCWRCRKGWLWWSENDSTITKIWSSDDPRVIHRYPTWAFAEARCAFANPRCAFANLSCSFVNPRFPFAQARVPSRIPDALSQIWLVINWSRGFRITSKSTKYIRNHI